MKKDLLAATGIFLVGVGIGAIAGILIFQKRIDKHYQAIADEEIESVRDTYKLLRKQPPYDDPKTAVKAYLERVDELQYLSEGGEPLDEGDYIEDEETPPLIIKSQPEGFWRDTEGNPDVITEEEMEDGALFGERSADAPYVISFQEFMDEREEFEKISIEYYEADNTLADDRELIITDVEGTIGRANLSRFGQGSQDPAIVYIRNESLGADFEVAHNHKGYAEIVLGVNDDPKPKKRIPKMREED